MLLAISADKIPLVLAIAGVLLVHYPLAVLATGRILQYKAKGLPEWLWHIIIQLGIIIGPVICLLVHTKKTSEKKVYKAKPPKKEAPEKQNDDQDGNV